MTHYEETEGLPSGSGFDADFRCPGKWLMERPFQKQKEESTTDAIRGQRIHDALQTSDLSGLSGGESLTASICMDNEAKLIEEYGFHDHDQVIWEKRYWDVDDDLNKLWSVKLDYLCISQKRGLIIDHKTGWGIPADIEQNWQIRSQAAITWFYHRFDEVVAALSHPHHPDKRMQVIKYSAKECAEYMLTIRGGVERIQMPDQQRIPSSFNCEYCMAKNICPERAAWLARIALDAKNEISERGYTALLDRTPEQRGEHYRSLKELVAHMKLLMERYTTMAVRDDGSVAGWKPTKSWRSTITDEARAMELVEAEFSKETSAASLVFSITECEEVVAKKLGIGKLKAKEKVETLLREVLKWKPSNPWLIERRNFYDNTTTHDSSDNRGTGD